jgi:hypothetical protein
MFAIACPQHGRRVLVPTSRIVDLVSGPDGTVAHLRCWCGEVVEWHAHRCGANAA